MSPYDLVCRFSLLPHICSLLRTGGDERDRTDDPLLAKQVLSQLSYTPKYLRRSLSDLQN